MRPPPDDKKPSKTRMLTHEELQIWHYVTQQDKRLAHADIDWQQVADKADAPLPTPDPAMPKADNAQLGTLLVQKPFTQAGQAHAPAPTQGGLDRNSARRLRQGKLPIEATLDLHGMSREEARNMLIDFLGRNFEKQKRCVLVITGKGRFQAESGRNDGVLRKQLPRWLALTPCANWVLRHERAQPHHGGEGAFYILLRRKR